MAEVEQKGKIRKWTYNLQAVIKFSQTSKPSKFEAGFGRFEHFGVFCRLVKYEYIDKNIADETFAEQTRPALSDALSSLCPSLTHSQSVAVAVAVAVAVVHSLTHSNAPQNC